MAVIETARGRIGITQGGGTDGDATPILFLHGVGSTKRVWDRQVAHFGATGRHAIAIDYPGYGESAFQPDATREDYAAAALAVLDALGIARAHVCGLSLGGVVAIAMATAAPDRIASLVIADSFAVHPDGQAIHDRAVAASEAMSMRALAEARAAVLLAPDHRPEVLAECIDTMATIDPAAYRLGARAVWLADQRERVAALTAPTLILCGEKDGITPKSLSEDLTRRIAGSRLVMIADAGHLTNIEQPEAFDAAVGAFLTV